MYVLNILYVLPFYDIENSLNSNLSESIESVSQFISVYNLVLNYKFLTYYKKIILKKIIF